MVFRSCGPATDGRPDDLTAKYAKGVDVFVTELQPDLARINQLKYGLPEILFNYTVDIHHTLGYATGYLINEVNPRCGMVTHLAYDNDTLNEQSADVRAHWKGLFLYGAPDVAVVNVTKDAIWHRMAALPGFSGQPLPKPTLMFGDRCRSPRAWAWSRSPGCRARNSRSKKRATTRLIRTSIIHRTFTANQSRSSRTRSWLTSARSRR